MYYIVDVKEVYTQAYCVQADSEEEAKQAIYDSEVGTNDDNVVYLIQGEFGYSHCLDGDKWEVRDATNGEIETYIKNRF